MADVEDGSVQWICMAVRDAARIVAESGAVDFILIGGKEKRGCLTQTRRFQWLRTGRHAFTREVVSNHPLVLFVEAIET